jgi:hypothetical protein
MKRMLQNWLLKRLFKAIVEEDIIAWNKLPDEKKLVYRDEAKAIVRMEVYKRIMSNIKWRAQERMFTKSRSWEDMFFGKAALYVVDLIDTKIKSISNNK